jgi:hypothetical protein
MEGFIAMKFELIFIYCCHDIKTRRMLDCVTSDRDLRVVRLDRVLEEQPRRSIQGLGASTKDVQLVLMNRDIPGRLREAPIDAGKATSVCTTHRLDCVRILSLVSPLGFASCSTAALLNIVPLGPELV